MQREALGGNRRWIRQVRPVAAGMFAGSTGKEGKMRVGVLALGLAFLLPTVQLFGDVDRPGLAVLTGVAAVACVFAYVVFRLNGSPKAVLLNQVSASLFLVYLFFFLIVMGGIFL